MSRIVLDLIGELRGRYDGELNFKKICADESIYTAKAKLPSSINGLYLKHGTIAFIILSDSLTREQRRDRAWHELYHHFRSVQKNPSEEKRAELFAALIRVPKIAENDTVETVSEAFGVSPFLAKVRIDFERKRLL